MATKKLSQVDMVTWLIQRRTNALANLEKHRKLGNLGQQVYWQTIAVDAGLLLGWVASDDYWTAMARSDASELQSRVDRLDIKDNPWLAKAS